jgi:uncharacterized protein (TIGR02001 family)
MNAHTALSVFRLASVVLLGAAPVASAFDLSGSAALTSDYVLRGISQTQGDATPQLGAKLTLDSGVYVAAWGSRVDYGPALGTDAEVDLSAGWNHTFGERWNLDLNLTRYFYPGTREPAYLDYNEVIATLTLGQRWWTMLAWSEDVFATGQRGVYVEVGAKFPLGDAFRFEIMAGHYDLDDAFAASYRRAQLSAIYTVGKIDLRASGHWTGGDAEHIFPGVAGSRFEVAAMLNF